VNAQSTAADAKVTAPAALLTLQGKGKKALGKAGLAAVLLSGSRKGSVSFAHIMSGKTGAAPGEKTGNPASSLAAAAAGLKGTAREVKDPWGPATQNPRSAAAQNPRSAAAQIPSGVSAQADRGEKASSAKLPPALLTPPEESEKLILGKDEKSDGKKKTARLISPPASVTAEAGIDKSKTAELASAAPKHIEAAPAQAQNPARLAVAPQIAAIRVVDLRKRTADRSSDAGVQRIAQTASASKETGTLFIPQQSALKDIEIPRKAAPASTAAPQTGLERLREMAGSELIRATNLILRDGGGEIRLVLKPESLGSVRIRMNLVDNKIEGRIIVDTSAVKQVLDQSIDALSRALTAGGFQTASLEVSVGGQNADNGRQMKEPPEEVRRVAAQGFERNIPMEESLSMGDLLVNLFV
jgi:flagellar hook-length control protein FliK